MVQDLNQVMTLDLVQCAVVMVRFVQVKDFLLYNKLVLNVLDQVRKLQILAIVVTDREKNKRPKGFQ